MTIVVGIDVGGPKKGFHMVALRHGKYLDASKELAAVDAADWCVALGARIVGVDAPCRWSITGRARPAERELMREKIWCFSTPSEQVAKMHSGKYYDWMLAGADLFRALEKNYRLHCQTSGKVVGHVCLETFPHAAACALSGRVVSAKQKRKMRSMLLAKAGISLVALGNIDLVDAALCALVAQCALIGSYRTYGDYETGLIVVPRKQLAV